MNILAKFGLVIDPKPATDGAKVIIKQLDDVKKAITDVTKTPVPKTGIEELGKAGKKAGADIAAGMNKATKSTRDAGDSARGAGSAFEGLVGKLMKFALAIGAAVVAWKTLSAVGSFAMSTIASAEQMEGFTTRWAFFLGSFDRAKEKMAELQQFANTTPFDLPGVTTAALALTRLKDTGLETMKGLRLVGDAAGVAGQPIEEVASRIARLTNNLKRGGGSGDEARILGEWQIFSPELVGRLAEMGTKASNFKVLLGEIKKELEGASGGMLLMSTTWDGLTSTMGDSWNTLKAAIGAPLLQGFKPLIMDITALIDAMTGKVTGMTPQMEGMTSKVKAIAAEIRDAALGFSATFRTVVQDGGLKVALAAAWDYLNGLMARTWNATQKTLSSIFAQIAYDFKAGLNALNTPKFWDGMVSAITSSLSRAIKAALPWVEKLDQYLVDKGFADSSGPSDALSEAVKRQSEIVENLSLPEKQAAEAEGREIVAELKAQEAARNAGIYPGQGDPLDFPDGKAGEKNAPLFDLGDRPPLVPFEMEKPVETPAIKEWNQRWLGNMNGVLNDLNKMTADAAALVEKKKKERDDAEAGKPDAGLFPDTSLPPKDAKLAETDMTWKETESAAEKYRDNIKTPEEVLAQEKRTLDEMVRLKLLSEAEKTKAVKMSEAEYTQSLQRQTAAAAAAAEAQKSGLQKLGESWGDLKTQADGAAVGIMTAMADTITGGLMAMIDGTKSASQAFADMATGIMNSILQIILKLVIQYALMSAMGMAAGIATPSFTGMATQSLSGGVMHTGGTVGEATTSRTVPAAVFSGAQRFHSGGMIGSNEVPIIAEKGETVMTKDQTADIKKRLSKSEDRKEETRPIQILNIQDPDQIRNYLMQNPDVVLNVMAQNSPKVRQIVRP